MHGAIAGVIHGNFNGIIQYSVFRMVLWGYPGNYPDTPTRV